VSKRDRFARASTLLAMASRVESAHASALERNWWLRAPAVLVAPRAVFVALRDESEQAVEARQEPITALIGLAGIAAVLGTPVARTMLNDGSSWLIVPIWAFLGGSFYALAVYWLGGGLLFGAARRLGSLGTYRRARHVLALSSAPLALSLFTLWPIRIAIYGEWFFRTGGNDYGTVDRVFDYVVLAVFAWCALLLVIGVRAVHGWGWGRSLATVGLAATLPVLLVLATHAHLAGGLN
jgi:hypothetical protein